jgi:hypothetical protein
VELNSKAPVRDEGNKKLECLKVKRLTLNFLRALSAGTKSGERRPTAVHFHVFGITKTWKSRQRHDYRLLHPLRFHPSALPRTR